MTISGLDVVAFDFDGVLCRSVDVKTEAFAALYADQGPDVVAAVTAYHHAHGGISRYHKIRHFETEFLGQPGDAGTVAGKAEQFARLVVAKVIASPLLPGTEAFLTTHAGHLPMFVVSGTPQDELRHIVTAKGLDKYFQGIFGSPTEKATHLAAILNAVGCPADRAAMVGDAMTDFTAAAATGLRFVGVQDARGRHPFAPGIPVIADLTGLADALANAPVAPPQSPCH